MHPITQDVDIGDERVVCGAQGEGAGIVASRARETEHREPDETEDERELLHGDHLSRAGSARRSRSFREIARGWSNFARRRARPGSAAIPRGV